MSDSDLPRLRAVTRSLDVADPSAAPDLLALADAARPLVWLRGDQGCVGVGESLRLSFTGPDRVATAAARWRTIAAAAEVDDPVRCPGSGLVAFGSFAFAGTSADTSVLVVPRVLVARSGDRWWITEITRQDPAGPVGAGADPELPSTRPIGAWPGVRFSDPARSWGVADTTDAAASARVEAYLSGVGEAVRRIDAGAFDKVVLSRQVTGVVPAGADLRVPIRRLSERYLDCWTYAVDGLIGASPETLVRSAEGTVSARVLAGTRGRHPEDPRRDGRERDELITSTKEQHEHAFAVQSVVTALSPHVRDLVTSEAPFPLRLPNVWHLATDLDARLDERSSALELVGALHPTAAVAGTPTSAAVAAIAELEPHDRERYAGAVGWIDAAGDGEWVIALRCAQLDDADGDRRVTASAGGGIVAGSDPAHELRETVSKLRPVTEAFA